MAINLSDSRRLIWQHVKYSVEFSFTFVKKYPFVLYTLLFFILFFALSPSITWFFVYSLPLLFFFTILLIVFFSIPNFKHFSRDDQTNAGLICSRKITTVDKKENVIDNKQKAFLRARSVRRRKSKNYIETGGEELKAGASFRRPFDDHDFVDKGALIEENLKDIREVEVHSVSDRAECSSSSIFKNSWHEYSDYSYEANGKPFKSFSSRYERKTEYFGESEEAGGRNKAVQWKEDDPKNLMDLGLSEIDRTKRLESLIARRRARKMLSLQVRRSLMNIGNKENFVPISSLIIPKNKSTGQCSPTPGSAPSILGPNRNPFDLPYDQHEEKPNLRGGSFMQEFMLAQDQKDLMFCRHESFTRGAAFSGDMNLDQRERTACSDHPSRQRFPEAPQHSKSRHRLGREDNDRIVEEVPSQASEPEMNGSYKGDHSRQGLNTSKDKKDSSDIQIKSVLVEDISNRASSSSSSEEDEPFYKIDKDAILKSIASPALRSLASDPSHPGSSLLENTREDEHFYPNHSMHRTPSQSIASDLQVEVSEVGSPPLTNNGGSSADEEISIDGEIEKAITSSSEDTLMSSSHLARVDENESRSKEVREVTEQDIVDFGFSRFQMSEVNVPQNIPSERLSEPDSIGSSSFPPPRTERSQASSYQQRRPEAVSVVNERFQASLLQPEFAVRQLPFPTPSLPSPTSVLQPNCLNEQGSSSNFDQVQNDRSVNISSERSDSIASQESELSLNNSTLHISEIPAETENSISAREIDIAEVITDSESEQHSEKVVFSTIGQGHHSIEASSTSSSMSVSPPNFATDQGSSSIFSQEMRMEAQQVEPHRVNKLPIEVTAESCDPNASQSTTLLSKESTVQSSVPNSQAQMSAENSKSLTSNEIQETLRDNCGRQHIEEVVFSTISQSFDDSQASSSPQDMVVEQVPIASSSSPSPNSMIQPRFSVNEGSLNSVEQKRVQDPIPGIQSERAVNQDFISLQSSPREVPPASSSSSSPKSVLQPKSSAGQGPPLISDREEKQFDGQAMQYNVPEEQVGESPSPTMSSNIRTLYTDSAADQLHHADAKTDQSKMSLDEVFASHVESPNKTSIVSSNSTTHHSSSASLSTKKNENSVHAIGTGEDRGAKEPQITHGPIGATDQISENGDAIEGEYTVAKEKIKSHCERTDSKEKVKD